MWARAREAVLQGTRWLDAVELADQAPTGSPPPNPEAWQRAGQIYALAIEGRDHFPAYAVDSLQCRPLPALAEVMAILGQTRDAWGMAVWFESVNSYLGGVRPRELLALDPARVICAARDDVRPIDHA